MFVETFIRNIFTNKLRGKRFVWLDSLKIYCDSGYPQFTLFPKYLNFTRFNLYWKLDGVSFIWLGREFNFVFGKDVNGLFKK